MATADPFKSEPWYFDVAKALAVGGSWDRFHEHERPDLRSWYLHVKYETGEIGSASLREMMQGPDAPPWLDDFIDTVWWSSYERYSSAWRRWDWRLAYEQLTFMHGSRTPISEHHKYGDVPGPSLIDTHLLFVAGVKDNKKPEYLYNHAIDFANSLWFGKTTGKTLWLAGGHSLHAEVPGLLAKAIVEFIHGQASSGDPNCSGPYDEACHQPVYMLTSHDGRLKYYTSSRDTAKAFIRSGGWRYDFSTPGGNAKFHTLKESMDGALPLYMCRTTNWEATFLSNDFRCSGSVRESQLGWVAHQNGEFGSDTRLYYLYNAAAGCTYIATSASEKANILQAGGFSWKDHVHWYGWSHAGQ